MVQRSASIAQTSWEALSRVQGDLLGVGLPAPKTLLRGYQPDQPDTWCQRCGGPRHVCTARDGPDQVIRLGPHDGALRDWIILIKHQQWEAMGVLLGTLLGQQIQRVDAYVGARAGERAFARVAPHAPAHASPHASPHAPPHASPHALPYPPPHALPYAPLQRDACMPRVVVPVPMPWLRRFERGIDHAQVLASAASAVLGCPCVQPLRQRLGGSQVEQGGRAARLQRTNRFVPRHRAHGGVARWCRAWWHEARSQRSVPSQQSAPSRRGVPSERSARSLHGAEVIVVDDVRTTGATLQLMAEALRSLGAARVVGAVLAVKE